MQYVNIGESLNNIAMNVCTKNIILAGIRTYDFEIGCRNASSRRRRRTKRSAPRSMTSEVRDGQLKKSFKSFCLLYPAAL
jgi:hypothetical protein